MALAALKDQQLQSDMNITVFLSGGEEAPGEPTSLGRKPLVDAATEE